MSVTNANGNLHPVSPANSIKKGLGLLSGNAQERQPGGSRDVEKESHYVGTAVAQKQRSIHCLRINFGHQTDFQQLEESGPKRRGGAPVKSALELKQSKSSSAPLQNGAGNPTGLSSPILYVEKCEKISFHCQLRPLQWMKACISVSALGTTVINSCSPVKHFYLLVSTAYDS